MSSLRRLVPMGDYLDDAESLRAYSYDASGFMATPTAVIRPHTEDQLRRIVLYAKQHHLHIIPRGGGTGTRGGAIRHDGLIVDMRNFATLERMDRQLHTITVGAGTPVTRLNQALKSYGYVLPMWASSPYATIGGLAAQNAASVYSLAYGDMSELVQQVELIDGLGRFTVLKGEDVSKAVGKEGSTGIIVRLKVKVIPLVKHSLTLIEVEDITEALTEAENIDGEGLVGAEYCDSIVSQLLGLGDGAHLLCIYEGQHGVLKEEERVKDILTARKKLIKTLWSEGYTVPEGATLDEDGLEGFANYCAEHKLPCYGHLGLGMLFTQLHTLPDRQSLWNKIVSLGGVPAAVEGFGRITAGYVPDKTRKEVRSLKEERDYNEIMNPDVLLPSKKVTAQNQEFTADSVRFAIHQEENDAFLASRDQRLSNRHVAFLLSKGIASPWLYKVPVYNRGTKDEDIIEMRSRMVSRGVETAANKEIALKIRAGKNCFR